MDKSRIVEYYENCGLSGKKLLNEINKLFTKECKTIKQLQDRISYYRKTIPVDIDKKLNKLQSVIDNKNKTVLVVGDLHIPAIKEGYLEFLNYIYNKYSCNEVVFIGDIIDNHYSSFHDIDPNGLSGGDELSLAISELHKFYQVFPKAKVCLGNHDQIIRRQAFANNIPKEWVKDYSDVLQTPGWEYDFEFEIDNVIYNHGLSGGGQRGAIKEAIMRGQSVVRGHFHSQCYVDWYANKDKKVFGMQVGSGCDDDSYALAYGKHSLHKSIISCGIVFSGVDAKVELMNL